MFCTDGEYSIVSVKFLLGAIRKKEGKGYGGKGKSEKIE